MIKGMNRYLMLVVLTMLFVSMPGQLIAEATTFNETGWIERVMILPHKLRLHAKLDTGADSSSLHARGMEIFTRKGEEWVRFRIKSRSGKNELIEKPVERWARVKRKNAPSDIRPVVRLTLCIGHIYMETDVSLVDRSNFAYPMLVGRNFMAGNIIINPAKTFTIEPQCQIQ